MRLSRPGDAEDVMSFGAHGKSPFLPADMLIYYPHETQVINPSNLLNELNHQGYHRHVVIRGPGNPER